MNDFGNIMKRRREQKGWTQKQLADALHVSSKSVSRWETNHGYPDITLLPMIAKVLELDYKELLEGSEYLIEKRKKKMHWIKWCVAFILFFMIVLGMCYFIKPQKKESSIRNQLLNDRCLSLTLSSHAYKIDEIQQSQFLRELNIDEWKLIKDEDRRFLNQVSSGDFQCKMILLSHDHQYDFDSYNYQNQDYIVLSNHSGYEETYEIYEIQKSIQIKNIDNHIIENMKAYYGYTNNHSISIQSDCLKEISMQKAQMLTLEYELNKPDLDAHDYIFIEDNQNQRYYFMLRSSQYDYQRIETKENNNELSIILTGESYQYQTPYIHIYEVLRPFSDIHIQYNDKDVHPFSIYHTLYPAKDIESFE